MTAREALRARALRKFAEAVKGLPVGMWKRCEWLEDALYRMDFAAWEPIVGVCVKRTGYTPAEAVCIDSRTDRRWLYRKLLTAYGIDARHV